MVLFNFYPCFVLAIPSNIEERNDYAVRKLQTLDQNINAKVINVVCGCYR